jgi:hypothetical protein
MESTTADRIVLVAGPGPEVLAALLILAIAMAGLAVGILMANRGRAEAWSLVGLFGLLALASMLALTHVPTRLVLDRSGAELAFWMLGDRRSWNDIAAVNVRRGHFGAWISFTGSGRERRVLSLWSRWPGLFVPDAAIEPHEIAMRIEAWRLASGG